MIFNMPDAFEAGIAAPSDAQRSEALWFVFKGAQLMVLVDGASAEVPRATEADALGVTPERTLYLGRLGGRHCFAAESGAESPGIATAEYQGMRALFGRLADDVFAVAGRAFQIVDWDRTHRFCGACGTPTRRRETERARECPACKLVAYPRIAPAIMALVRDGRRLLLARSPHFAPGMYSALAGFVEPGESLEQCIAREVREEVGVEVRNVRYFGSQSWPFPHSMMIAFVADYAGGELRPDPAEIQDAAWFEPERLPTLPGRISISRRLIDAVLADIVGATSAA